MGFRKRRIQRQCVAEGRESVVEPLQSEQHIAIVVLRLGIVGIDGQCAAQERSASASLPRWALSMPSIIRTGNCLSSAFRTRR